MKEENASHFSDLERKIDLILESLNPSISARRTFLGRDSISEEPAVRHLEEGRSFNFGDDTTSDRVENGELSGAGQNEQNGVAGVGGKL